MVSKPTAAMAKYSQTGARALISRLLLGGLALLCIACAKEQHQGVHVAVLTDCTKYFNWQAVGMQFAFRMSGQPGTYTRVMCCSLEDFEKYNRDLFKAADTWLAPDVRWDDKTKESYGAYNKPEAVIDWLDNNIPNHEYVLVLDADMILRRPFFVETMKPRKGLAVGARYTYMIGVANELAKRHIPNVAPRNDTLAGPFGRRADMVGGFFFMHRDDLKAMSHDWLKYTEDVRLDPVAYNFSGDQYATKPGQRPWISEMYGYAFGAANNNVWHRWDNFSMIYPANEPSGGIPKVMHYGLHIKLDKYEFRKKWYMDFDVTKCPPWNLNTTAELRREGIFPFAPRPDEVSSKNSGVWIEWYRDLLVIETASALNAAFCDFHLSRCPPSQQLLDVCTEVVDRYNEVTELTKLAEMQYTTQDFHVKCPEWAKSGECQKNPIYMGNNCRVSCGLPALEVEVYIPNTSLTYMEIALKALADRLANPGGSGPLLQAVGEVDDPDEVVVDADLVPGKSEDSKGLSPGLSASALVVHAGALKAGLSFGGLPAAYSALLWVLMVGLFALVMARTMRIMKRRSLYAAQGGKRAE